MYNVSPFECANYCGRLAVSNSISPPQLTLIEYTPPQGLELCARSWQMQLTLARDGDDRDAGAGARSMYDTLQRKATCTSQAAELAAAEERIATDAATAAKREASALKTAAYARELGLDGPRMSYGALSNGHATYVPGCELSAAIGPGGALEAGAAQLAAGPTMERGLHATLGGALMPSASTASLSSARSELEAVWRERALVRAARARRRPGPGGDTRRCALHRLRVASLGHTPTIASLRRALVCPLPSLPPPPPPPPSPSSTARAGCVAVLACPHARRST